MTFCVEYDEGFEDTGLEDLDGLFKLTASEALSYTGCPYECEADLTITGDEGIRSLNKEYRDKDAPTDVLSFPLLSYDEPGNFDGIERDFADCFNPESGELMLGSIVIDINRAKEQAKEYGHSLKREVAFLIVHSMLHLQGFDHITDEDRAEMEKAQEKILTRLNILREASFEE